MRAYNMSSCYWRSKSYWFRFSFGFCGFCTCFCKGQFVCFGINFLNVFSLCFLFVISSWVFSTILMGLVSKITRHLLALRSYSLSICSNLAFSAWDVTTQKCKVVLVLRTPCVQKTWPILRILHWHTLSIICNNVILNFPPYLLCDIL